MFTAEIIAVGSPPFFISDFASGCNHKCFMHLKVALSTALIVVMELF